ncbi:hypothetical protein PHMEG_00027086 [Phytophthora megakarya]|uniref:Uncharacterized protein n=1 Tax=Phytophthora megakarya TaxID=4795 RepID=A0A225V8S1_9STRA|nr:hypothetical protein PHMEG_00027086 [Phytophthora megakarya]
MSLRDHKHANTKQAQTPALAVFERYLVSEGTSMVHVGFLIVVDPAKAGVMLVTIMDKFDYYHQVKCWFMDQYPQHFGLVERQFLKQGRTLEQHCIKRESDGFAQKASPCTEDDLKKMMMYLYTNASTLTDYQDADFQCLLWYLLGPASDLTFLSIDAGNVFFIRFIRVKTSEKQALSLFPDEDYATCPLLVLALALITQGAPCTALLNRQPDEVKSASLEVSTSIPLLELLGNPLTPPTQSSASTSSTTKRTYASPFIGIHALVNRLLDRVSRSAEVETSLSSHSFRRGGPQHANASSELTALCILDRGAWNLPTTYKAFAYVFNTPKEDHRVAKVLSGMTPKQAFYTPFAGPV